ncbi:MAG: flagellar protein FlaG [Lachnospiraceae bacterium]|nr:flagellar protein FlaG [Lachnospiraceae bacterium]
MEVQEMTVETNNSISNSFAAQGSTASIQTSPVSNVNSVEAVEEPVIEESDVRGNRVQEALADDGDGTASEKQLKEAVSKINKSLGNTEAVFGFHDKTHRVTIKLLDKETHKVVKEIPAEKTLDLIAKAWEMAGILVDEKR